MKLVENKVVKLGSGVESTAGHQSLLERLDLEWERTVHMPSGCHSRNQEERIVMDCHYKFPKHPSQ